MLAFIRRFELHVIALAIVGLGTGIGVSASQHSGYQSTEVVQLLPGPNVKFMRHLVTDARFLRNVATIPRATERLPVHVAGTANELKARLSTKSESRHLYTITATGSTPLQAVSLVRAVTADSAAAMLPGSKQWMRILDKPSHAVAIGSSPVAVDGSIGLGLGLALGLLMAAALSAFPGRKQEPATA